MKAKLTEKMDREVAEFNKRLSEGELPEAVFKNMLRRVIKEQDRDTRHACAEHVLQSNGPDDAHDICMNIDVLGH